MNRQFLKLLMHSSGFTPIFKKAICRKKCLTYRKFVKATSYLSETATLSERIYHIKNDLYTQPICPICKKNLITWHNKRQSYPKTCSVECGNYHPERLTAIRRNTSINTKRVKQAREESNLQNYGDINPFKTTKGKEKVKETNIKKYGFSCPSRNKEVRAKQEKTLKARYGTVFPANTEDKIREKLLKFYRDMLNSEIVEYADPLFTEEDYIGCCKIGKPIYKWKCKKCKKIFESNFHSQKIPKCPICYGTLSYPELKIGNLFSEKGYKVEYHNRTLISPYEIDVYVPEINLGIEYNSNQYHTTLIKHIDKNYHLNKSKLAEDIGLRLIHIYTTEFKNKWDIITSLFNIICNNSNSIYARKTSINQVSKNDEKAFLELNHLQGYAASSVAYGLYFEGQLISLMSFIKSRFDHKFEWEILRYSTKLNTNVVGGFSKLLKTFERAHKPKSILSYADRGKFTGGTYIKNGFKFVRNTMPSYFYVKGDIVLSRFKAQKQKIKYFIENFDKNLSEKENMVKNKFYPVYDSGNRVFTKTYTNITPKEG